MKADGAGESLAIPALVRAAVDARDGTRCRVCGRWLGERRALHHIRYGGDITGMGGRRKHLVDEIATVCWLPGDPVPGSQPCHELVHSDKALWMPLLLAAIATPNLTARQLQRWATIPAPRHAQENA